MKKLMTDSLFSILIYSNMLLRLCFFILSDRNSEILILFLEIHNLPIFILPGS